MATNHRNTGEVIDALPRIADARTRGGTRRDFSVIRAKLLRRSGNRENDAFHRQETPVEKSDVRRDNVVVRRCSPVGDRGRTQLVPGWTRPEIHDPQVAGKFLRGVGQVTITDNVSE